MHGDEHLLVAVFFVLRAVVLLIERFALRGRD
jgi:hypothetical protein